MSGGALSVYLGRRAASLIADQGWHPDLFSLLLGASGGPKWLILGQLDRFLFGDFLQRSGSELSVLGSSIGAWRHACLAMPDPVAALDRFEQAYLQQQYSARPTATEISTASMAMLAQVLGEDGAAILAGHPRIRSHIVTARGRGPAGATRPGVLGATMGAAAIGNAVHRRCLNLGFQRVVFHSGDAAATRFNLSDFDTTYTALRRETVAPVLHASGAIPFVLKGERDIGGAPLGQYWDGGIIDYHFNLSQYAGHGLMLYPHFRDDIIPGWFDKFLPWRKAGIHGFDDLVLLCPSREFIAALPHGKIPDRSDFRRLPMADRVTYWQRCIDRSQALAEEFAALVDGPDPLSGVTVFS
ncbi:alpha/beta hydrolase [Kineobactrum sediminis]|uniref:Alpha/beta hydrolase n=1 Tax=Kineobactrum sediminis TaxID=1905677 RepID=A0A2N5Y6V7_9GAMM|nr:alpha/beta hydrolase [Kineobactrum sediminis]PLW84122.1 alpha/beta hydrolase [Kineobactrum sediminis]